MNDANENTADFENHRVDDAAEGIRLDVYVNEACGWNSRNRIKDLVKLGAITVNGGRSKPSYRVRSGDRVTIRADAPPDDTLIAENIPLPVLYEDASLLIFDKPPHLPVHPGAGQRTGTMANALAYHYPVLSDVAGATRPGIVHRLDRDTTGVICVARTNRAHFAVTAQFAERTTEKIYYAIAEGVMEFDEYVVDEPIGRHPRSPQKMAVVPDGRTAMTKFEVLERFDSFTWVRCRPRSGRTHQIRVHLAHLRHPIACDGTYGRRNRISLADIAGWPADDSRDRTLLARHALHAGALTIYHPLLGERVTYEAPLHEDMNALLEALREYRRLVPTELKPKNRNR